MNILLIPLIIVTIILYIKRNKSQYHKRAFIFIGIATLALLAITLMLVIAMRDI